MFNDTLAYGREHNNTVPDARRIWTDWFSKWGREAKGDREYLYNFCGFGAPLSMKKENTFNSGSTIPEKFALKDFNGFYNGGAMAKLYVAPVVAGEVG